MLKRNFAVILCLAAITAGALLTGCSEDSPYDQRTVMLISYINDGSPYFSDVLNQGDSLFYTETETYKLSDDFVEEDYVKIRFHNRPYNSIADPDISSLGDFLVTHYDVEFTNTADPDHPPVQEFTGMTSILIPANSEVEAFILLVPFSNKNDMTGILRPLRYTGDEVHSYVMITFHGHEVQTDRNISFTAGVTVNFADPLCVDDGT